MQREQLATRLGFLAMTAGCAIGLGNIWRFPYITGKYGGAVFVLIYLFFLALIGFPAMVAELSLGRASQSDLPGAYKKLSSGKMRNIWPVAGHIVFCGNTILLMFYTVITGWMLAYCWKYVMEFFPAGSWKIAFGAFPENLDSGAYFKDFTGNWKEMLVFDALTVFLTAGICCGGLKNSVEKAMKVMLGGLFILQFVMIIMVLCQKGAGEGLRFFLYPDFSKLSSAGYWPVIQAAMMQAFFTLSLGIGSVAICGSYINKEHSLSKESICIISLDTLAAIASGLIIFPACFAYHIAPDAGPSLIFVSLTKVFANIPGGKLLGLLFFVFMSVAALSTMVAVAENIIAYFIRMLKITRISASLLFAGMLFVLSLPCLFGFNLLSSFQPFGKDSSVLDLEDFIVSDNLLPLGAVLILLFCTRSCGWGMQNFLNEADAGKGMRFPRFMILYTKWFLPLGIFLLWANNLLSKFFFNK